MAASTRLGGVHFTGMMLPGCHWQTVPASGFQKEPASSRNKLKWLVRFNHRLIVDCNRKSTRKLHPNEPVLAF